MDNKPKIIKYQQKWSFFEKLSEYISDFLLIDFFKPFSEYYYINECKNTWWPPFLEKEISFDYPFENIKENLLSADLNIFNLECPLSIIKPHYNVFGVDTKWWEYLKKYNFNHLCIANNHAFDLWRSWFIDTLQTLEKNGIKYFWWWFDSKLSVKPAIFHKWDTKIALLGYLQNYKININEIIPTDTKAWINPMCFDDIKKDIWICKNKYKADLVFVTLHWDLENTTRIHSNFEKLSHNIIDVWADWIFWHHSHVPKAIEIYKWKAIFYSLWNFIFGSYYKRFWWDNFFANLLVDNWKITKIQLIPISWKWEKLLNPEILHWKNADKLINKLRTLSKKYKTNIVTKNDNYFVEI